MIPFCVGVGADSRHIHVINLINVVNYVQVCQISYEVNVTRKATDVYVLHLKACVAGLKRLRKTGMKIGGRHRFVVVDESKFAHKRKVGCVLLIIVQMYTLIYVTVI